MNGYIGSTDASHSPMLNCAIWASVNYQEYKLKTAGHSYNITLNHSRRKLNSTCGHQETWNDKTIVLYDDLIRGVHEEEYLFDHVFELYQYDLDGNIITSKYKGVWFIFDNGYLDWSCTPAPIATPMTYEDI